MDGKIGCYRITVADKIEIPSKSEVIIEGKVQLPILKTDSLAIIEPIDGSFLTGKAVVVKALVHTKDNVPLRIINVGQENETLFSGTHVANLSLVSNVHCSKVKNDGCSQPIAVPTHLQDL